MHASLQQLGSDSAQLAIRRVLAEPALQVQERVFTIAEVLASAALDGEAAVNWQRVFMGAACLEYAREDGFTVDELQLRQALNGWRRRRNLISAHDTHRWLGRHGLTPEDLRAYLLRRTLIAAYANRARGIGEPSSAAQRAALGFAAAELLLSTQLDTLIEAFATQRVAQLCCLTPDAPSVTRSPSDARIASALWLSNEAFRECVEVDHAYRRVRAGALQPSAATAALAADSLALTQLEYDTVSSANCQLVHELACCVLYDGGGSLRAIALDNRIEVGSARAFIEDLRRQPSAALLVGAEPGSLVGPAQENGEWVLHQVTRATPPSLEDSSVRERLIDRVLNPRLAALTSDLVSVRYSALTATPD